jgi:Tol biopolymer transport system component
VPETRLKKIFLYLVKLAVMKILIISSALLLVSHLVFSQNNMQNVFKADNDIGNVKQKGSLKYNDNSQQYTISGSGQNIWGNHDDFHFAWKKMKGNFILDAQVKFIGNGSNPHRKIGWMVRHSLEPNTVYADAAVHGEGLTSLQYRREIDSATEEIKTDIKSPDVIRLERKGSTYIFSAAKFGDNLKEVARLQLNIGDDVYAGIFICSHDENVSEEAVFSNVRISIPAKDNFVPYKDYPGSRLEVMDVETGLRKVIFTSDETFEAPNWLKDGSALIFNWRGLLNRFPLDTKIPVVLNTDFAKHCNNDHILSPDNKFIGISNNGTKEKDGGGSVIHIVSINGGMPVQITQATPSYLHGWSPDGKTLAFCGERNKNFDVYTIPVKGGKEKRLTTAEGLDDGPEYSPDGKYIYFNSVRSGSMQIWRMKPDGSHQEQLTNDDYNNWFAHISPDGKWMVFISFTKDVPKGDHPPCKRVMLRLLPSNGNGQPKAIAYLYGGQGTINVPSWSPDGKQIAFVSYTFPDDYYEKK